MKSKSQEEEIRRLREALYSGDPLNRYSYDDVDNSQIYMKLKTVVEENKELGKMVSAGRVEQLGLEIALLKREIEMCKERTEGFGVWFRLIVEYKRVMFEMDDELEKVVGIVEAYRERFGELE
jgi:hypothetical protein